MGVADLASVRFAVDPVAELVAACFALVRPESQAIHGRLREAAPSLAGPLAVLGELCADPREFPDLLAPQPDPTITDPIVSIERVRGTPPAILEEDLAWIRRRLPGSRSAALDGPALLDEVTDGLRHLWLGTIEPMWPRMRALLEADIAHRSARLGTDGLGAALEGLHRSVTFDGNSILVDKPMQATATAQGGLWLVPSVFWWPSIAVQCQAPRPVLCYAARGAALVWDQDRAAPDAVSRLLGRTRADVLVRCGVPATTTHLAGELGLAKATVSEHLAALTEAGLVIAHRRGRIVLYERTALGDDLLGPVGTQLRTG